MTLFEDFKKSALDEVCTCTFINNCKLKNVYFFFQFDSKIKDSGHFSNKFKETLAQELGDLKRTAIELNKQNKGNMVKALLEVTLLSAAVGAVGAASSAGVSALGKGAGKLLATVGAKVAPATAEGASAIISNFISKLTFK